VSSGCEGGANESAAGPKKKSNLFDINTCILPATTSEQQHGPTRVEQALRFASHSASASARVVAKSAKPSQAKLLLVIWQVRLVGCASECLVSSNSIQGV
jgi:hypothetical protein